ncbi:MAG: hypothetical protein P1U34_04620 [Coxiellaceae bacterium]|nr:hypothetical protein [Coxiellaceae bacterium]
MSRSNYVEMEGNEGLTPMHASKNCNKYLLGLPTAVHKQAFISTAWLSLVPGLITLCCATLPYLEQFTRIHLPSSSAGISEAFQHQADHDMGNVLPVVSSVLFIAVFAVMRFCLYFSLLNNGDDKLGMPCVTIKCKQAPHQGLLRYATPVIVTARVAIAVSLGIVLPIVYGNMDIDGAVKGAKDQCAPLFDNPSQAMTCAQSFFKQHCQPFRQVWWTVFAVSAAILVLDLALLCCQNKVDKKPVLETQLIDLEAKRDGTRTMYSSI